MSGHVVCTNVRVSVLLFQGVGDGEELWLSLMESTGGMYMTMHLGVVVHRLAFSDCRRKTWKASATGRL